MKKSVRIVALMVVICAMLFGCGKQTAQPENTASESAISCNVEIECKSILENMGDLKPGHESFVPEDGIILASCRVGADEKATALDVLKKACEDNGITLDVQDSTYGPYISGINDIDAMDCGDESGWMYYVNGESAMVGCGEYEVSDGDTITFSYICSYDF